MHGMLILVAMLSGLGMFVHRGVRLLGSRSRSQGTTFSKSSQIEEAVLVAVDITTSVHRKTWRRLLSPRCPCLCLAWKQQN